MANTSNIVFAGTAFLDRVPEQLRAWLAENLDDVVWGAIETGSKRPEGAVWFVASEGRNALVAASDSGRHWQDLALEAEVSTSTKLAKLRFVADGQQLFEAARFGSGDLEKLFELAFISRAKGLLAAGRAHMASEDWNAADELLRLAERAVGPTEREQSVAFLNVAQEITLEQAACAARRERDGDALVMLAAVSDDRPGDDLLRATEAQHDTPGWLLTLALAHQEAGQHGSAARVYEALYAREPKEDLLLLSRARALKRAGDPAAAEVYGRFIDGLATDEVVLAAESDDIADFVAACVESAALLETLERPAEAAQRYLALIRRAPFETAGYERLFALDDAIEDNLPSVVAAAEVLHIINPAAATQIANLPPRHVAFDLPLKYAPIVDEVHDEQIVHAGERASSTLVQRWLGSLTRDERDTTDIERHAQRVDDDEVSELMLSVARLCGVDAPRLYLSHGSAGVEVLGTREPFVLLGACHLDETDPLHLTRRELAFTLASQVEHIRANHVLLTSSEFWRTFGTKSATAVLAFVPLGDVVSKFADGSLLKWVKKLGGTSSGTLRTALELAEKRIAEGGTGQQIQSAYTATLAKVRSTALTEATPDEASLVKERLADFARAAQYTADRVGLLACDEIGSCVLAMVRLSPSLSKHADVFATDGLRALMEAADDDPALEELVLRVAELLRFALSDDYSMLRAQLLREI